MFVSTKCMYLSCSQAALVAMVYVPCISNCLDHCLVSLWNSIVFAHPRVHVHHSRFLAYLHRTFREQPLSRAWFIDLCAADADFLHACLMGGPMSHQGAREAFADLLLSAVQMHRGAGIALVMDEVNIIEINNPFVFKQTYLGKSFSNFDLFVDQNS
jgi:hypothetical protein